MAGWAGRRDRRRVRLPICPTGSEHRVPIRERFEIADLATLGQEPFLAVADEKNGLQARWAGPWSDAGYRQTEVDPGLGRGPTTCGAGATRRPDVAIESLEIVPRGRGFWWPRSRSDSPTRTPFVRDGAVPVRIDLKDAELAARPLGPARPACRSRSTAASPATPINCPSAPRTSSWPTASPAGASRRTRRPVRPTPRWPRSRRRRVERARSASETRRCGPLGRRARATARSRRTRVRVEIVEDGRNWVETVVVDDATGQPVPCRVHFRSPDGVPYQPHGHHAHVNSNNDTWHVDVGGDVRLGQISYAYIDGRCQGWLPRGEVLVDVARGFEYEPLRQRVTIEPGQRRLELRLRRWTEHERSSAGSAATPTSTSSRRRAACARRRPRTSTSSTCCSRSGAACSPTPRSSPASRSSRATAGRSSGPPRRTASTCSAT